MAINEDLGLGLQEYPRDHPPGVERRTARRLSGERSSRSPGREQGSLRIRLSDNELRAARLIQERFQLRSTVAALGLCLRTMAQMVEQGQLSEENLATQLPQHSGPGHHGGRQQPKNQAPAIRPDPLARPIKQEPKPPEDDQPPNPAAEGHPLTDDDPTADSLQPEEA
ncbi:hypothetical protein [Candidatus Synechococcus spongiarum]|uniref:Uncharacterized protein n=1 Tax=Candidatus Synechococcus spongiarum TaxID=431041 RepID=A0A161KFX0_9SYNE|nr:hypothetical protein [Candidatus Synechococcus spongiarum]CZE42691.1 hypothetical protein FLM9_5 [Candidatus Synechococcus spongiarum]